MLLRRMGEHDDLWGWYLNNRSTMRRAQGNLAQAIDDAREAIAAKGRAFGPGSPDVGISFQNLSGYLVEAGAMQDGIEASARAIDLLAAGLGPDHPKTALALSNHGEWLCRTRNFAEAVGFAERAAGDLRTRDGSAGALRRPCAVGHRRLQIEPGSVRPCAPRPGTRAKESRGAERARGRAG